MLSVYLLKLHISLSQLALLHDVYVVHLHVPHCFAFVPSSIAVCRYCLKAILIILPLMGFTWLFGTLAAFNYSEVVRDIFSGLFVVCNTFQVCAKLKQTRSCSTGFSLPTIVSTFASVTCTHRTSCGYGTFPLCILFAGSYSCCCCTCACVCGGGMWV